MPQEAEPSSKIWRYLDHEKFEDLISSKTLYFASARQFGEKFEGAISTSKEFKLRHCAQEQSADLDLIRRSTQDAFEDLRRLTKISCWHINKYESAAMWEIYLKQGAGVAIQTTVGKLKESLGEFRLKPEFMPETIHFGAISYVDFSKHRVDSNMTNRFFYKRKSFSYEQEYRALISLRIAQEFVGEIPEEGIKVPIDPDKLIENIVVAPEIEPSYKAKIEEIIEKHGLCCSVNQSNLDEDPIY